MTSDTATPPRIGPERWLRIGLGRGAGLGALYAVVIGCGSMPFGSVGLGLAVIVVGVPTGACIGLCAGLVTGIVWALISFVNRRRARRLTPNGAAFVAVVVVSIGVSVIARLAGLDVGTSWLLIFGPTAMGLLSLVICPITGVQARRPHRSQVAASDR